MRVVSNTSPLSNLTPLAAPFSFWKASQPRCARLAARIAALGWLLSAFIVFGVQRKDSFVPTDTLARRISPSSFRTYTA